MDRKELNEKLKEEFTALHERVMKELKGEDVNVEAVSKLVRAQIDLSGPIIREERAIHGENAYAFPPYM